MIVTRANVSTTSNTPRVWSYLNRGTLLERNNDSQYESPFEAFGLLCSVGKQREIIEGASKPIFKSVALCLLCNIRVVCVLFTEYADDSGIRCCKCLSFWT